jgi:hypothetical protein
MSNIIAWRMLWIKLRTLPSAIDSIWTPGGFPESMWSLYNFLFDGSPANSLSRIHVESSWPPCHSTRTLPSATDSMWTPGGLQVDFRSPCGV